MIPLGESVTSDRRRRIVVCDVTVTSIQIKIRTDWQINSDIDLLLGKIDYKLQFIRLSKLGKNYTFLRVNIRFAEEINSKLNQLFVVLKQVMNKFSK